MPLTDIKTTQEWYPESGVEYPEGSKQNFTRDLRREMPDILERVCENLGWEFNPATALPDIVPPYHKDTAAQSDVPDVHVIFRPNWTEDRWDQRNQVRRYLLEELDVWAVMHQCEGRDNPNFDVDIDFVVGCGATLTQDGEVRSFWPDKIPAPYDLR